MIYHEKPTDFDTKFEVAGCFVEVCGCGEILLLLRQGHKPQPNTWGMPAGKRNSCEDILETAIREVKEETGIETTAQDLKYYCELFVRYPEYDVVFHIHHLLLPDKLPVTINPEEHKEFRWVTPAHALSLPLIGDLDQCIKLFYGL